MFVTALSSSTTAKTTVSRTSKGPVGFQGVDASGGSVVLENTSSGARAKVSTRRQSVSTRCLVGLSLNQSVHAVSQSASQSVNDVNRSVNQSISTHCQSVSQSVNTRCQSVSQSICQSISHSIQGLCCCVCVTSFES